VDCPALAHLNRYEASASTVTLSTRFLSSSASQPFPDCYVIGEESERASSGAVFEL
jgi:hypothetical protein